jgi:hypothetical protein
MAQAQPAEGNMYRMVCRQNNVVMQIQNQSLDNLAKIEVGTYNESNHQHFKLFAGTAAGYFKISSMLSAKCLDINANSTAEGLALQQYTCTDEINKQFSFVANGNGSYRIVSRVSGKCIGLGANNLVTQQTYTGLAAQQWNLIEVFPYGHKNGISTSQIGFLPTDKKTAVLLQTDPVSSNAFTILNAANAVVYTGTLVSYGDKWLKKYYVMDFSGFTTPGVYRLRSNGYTSYAFTIDRNIWKEKTRRPEYFTSVMNYQRCTNAKEPGDVSLPAYLKQGGDVAQPVNLGFRKDVSGGWFSATSRDKHITEAQHGCNAFMWAYLYNQQFFPETVNAMPVVLDEVKWTMDFMLRMQDTDGGEFMAVHPARDPWEPANVPAVRHLFANKSTGLTARAMSSFALGYTVFKNAQPAYANQLLQAARKANTWIQQNPNVYLADNIRPGYWNGMSCSRILAAVEMYIALKDLNATEANAFKTFADNAFLNGTMTNGAWNSNGIGPNYSAYDQIINGDIVYALCRYLPYATGAVRTKMESSLTAHFNHWNVRRNNPFGWMDDLIVPWFGGCGYTSMAASKMLMSGYAMNNPGMIQLGKNLAQVNYGFNPFQRTYVYGTGTNTFPDIYQRPATGSVGGVVPGIKLYNNIPVDDYRISPPDYTTGEITVANTPVTMLVIALMDRDAALTTTINTCASSINTTAEIICPGGNAVLSAAAPSTTYKWYSGTTLVGSAATYNATVAGSYSLEQVFANGCTARSAARTISVSSVPTAQITTSSTSFCQGTTRTLTASAGASHRWLLNNVFIGTGTTWQATQAGSYQVEVSNAIGCKALSPAVVLSYAQSLTWFADTDGDGRGDASQTLSSCTQPAGYVAVAGDGCPTDRLKTAPGNCGCNRTESSCLDCAGVPNGTAALDACGVCAGGTTGRIPVTNAANCGGTSDPSGIQGPSCGLPSQSLTYSLDADKRANATAFSWWFTGSSSSVTPSANGTSATIVLATYFTTGDVCVGVNMAQAPYFRQYCRSIGTCALRETATQEEAVLQQIKVYPNPAHSELIIHSEHHTFQGIQVVNVLGEIVKTISNPGHEVLLSTESLSPGMYTVLLWSEKGIYRRTLEVVH